MSILRYTESRVAFQIYKVKASFLHKHMANSVHLAMTVNKPIILSSVEELISYVERCNDCCRGDYTSFHCPLCPPSRFKTTRQKKVQNHLRAVHWKSRVDGQCAMLRIHSFTLKRQVT